MILDTIYLTLTIDQLTAVLVDAGIAIPEDL